MRIYVLEVTEKKINAIPIDWAGIFYAFQGLSETFLMTRRQIGIIFYFYLLNKLHYFEFLIKTEISMKNMYITKNVLGQNTVVKFSVEYVIVICNDDLR